MTTNLAPKTPDLPNCPQPGHPHHSFRAGRQAEVTSYRAA